MNLLKPTKRSPSTVKIVRKNFRDKNSSGCVLRVIGTLCTSKQTASIAVQLNCLKTPGKPIVKSAGPDCFASRRKFSTSFAMQWEWEGAPEERQTRWGGKKS